MTIATRRPAPPEPVPIVPPHLPLPAYYSDEGGRRDLVKAWFDAAAPDYDRINDIMSLGSGVFYRGQASARAGLSGGDRLLDVGSGTGVIAALAQSVVGESGFVLAIDPSAGMLAQARERGVDRRVMARGESLPLKDASFDVLSMGYALRHVADLGAAFREYARVLRPGGRVLLLEITRPRARMGFLLIKFYLRVWVPLLTRFFQRDRLSAILMRYYWDTIESCVTPEQILESLAACGFEDVRRETRFGIFSEYTGVKVTPYRSTNDEG